MKKFILMLTALSGLGACSKNVAPTKTTDEETVHDSLILQTPNSWERDSEYIAPTSNYVRKNSQIWHSSSTGHRSHAAHASHSSHFSAHQ